MRDLTENQKGGFSIYEYRALAYNIRKILLFAVLLWTWRETECVAPVAV